jgi:Glycosyl hydrolase catalytic core
MQRFSKSPRTRLIEVLLVLGSHLGCSSGTAGRDAPPTFTQTPQGSASASASQVATLTPGAGSAPPADGGPLAAPGNLEPFSPQSSSAVTISGASPKPVAATFFGQNYWSWVPEWGDPVAQVLPQVTDLRLGLLRAGGANNDTQQPVPFSSTEITDFIAFARAIGAAPLLQIPVLDDGTGAPTTPEKAAALVTEFTQGSEQVDYFSIGNEPDLYVDQGHRTEGYDALAACDTFLTLADAMREANPNIRVLGPDLAWKYQANETDWLSPFLEACGASVDVVSIHRYPFAPEACDEAAAFGDGEPFRETIAHVRALMAATGQGDKPLAFTEANITYDGSPELSVNPASPGTFLAALWLADSLGVALEEQIFSMSYWSLSEGWSLGFFDGTTPRPAYHVLRLVAQNFGTQVLSVSDVPGGLRVYAGRDSAAGISSVVVVNQAESDVALDITLVDLPRSAPVTLPLRAKSLLVARIPDDGSEPTLLPYTPRMAAEGIAP